MQDVYAQQIAQALQRIVEQLMQTNAFLGTLVKQGQTPRPGKPLGLGS